ncbi:hypothetical protein V7127_23975, partial [Bacillus sp. JJ1773]
FPSTRLAEEEIRIGMDETKSEQELREYLKESIDIVHSEKILVFNLDISSDLFAYIEDKYDGGKGYFIEGIPSKENLMKQYWESMSTHDDYLKHKPLGLKCSIKSYESR